MMKIMTLSGVLRAVQTVVALKLKAVLLRLLVVMLHAVVLNCRTNRNGTFTLLFVIHSSSRASI
jgi:hypothetical protein